MDNLKDTSNRIDAEASTSSNQLSSSSKKRKLSSSAYQNELKSMKQKLDKQTFTICHQANELVDLKQQNKEKDEKIKEMEERLSSARHVPDHVESGRKTKKKIKKLKAKRQSKTIAKTSPRAEMTQMQQNNNVQTKVLQDEIIRLNAIIKEQDHKSKETEQKLATEMNTVAELQLELEKMQKCYKADLQKTSPNQKAHNQNQIKELNAAKESYAKLYCQHEELKQKELNTRAIIINRDNQIHDLQNMLAERAQVAERIVDLDELCDDSGFRYDRLLDQNSITVIKVKNILYTGRELIINCERRNRNVRLDLLGFILGICRFQVNGECDLCDLKVFKAFKEIMPSIHSFNLKTLDFGYYTIDYEKFMKLVSSHTITTFIGGSIKRENDEYLTIDEILKELPNIENFELKFCCLSEKDCKNLVQLPTFSKLRKFKLQLTKSPSDLISFVGFIMKHQNAEFTFSDYLLPNKDRNSFREKVQKLRVFLPSNCKVFLPQLR